MLFDELELSHNVVLQCTGDADSVIVSKVLDNACAGNSVKLIGADIELQSMSLHLPLLSYMQYLNNYLGQLINLKHIRNI